MSSNQSPLTPRPSAASSGEDASALAFTSNWFLIAATSQIQPLASFLSDALLTMTLSANSSPPHI